MQATASGIWRSVMVGVVGALLCGCQMTPATSDVEARLRADVLAICEGMDNASRQKAIVAALEAAGVSYRLQQVRGDAHNIVANSRDPEEDAVYMCHYDATCALTFLFRQVSLGFLDGLPQVSPGAWDNAGSCAVGIELARQGRHVVFTCLEESGNIGAAAYIRSQGENPPEFAIVLQGLGASETARASTLVPFGFTEEVAWWGTDTRTVLLSGPPPMIMLDFAAASMGIPVGRYHGMLDGPWQLEPELLADAVDKAQSVPHYMRMYGLE